MKPTERRLDDLLPALQNEPPGSLKHDWITLVDTPQEHTRALWDVYEGLHGAGECLLLTQTFWYGTKTTGGIVFLNHDDMERLIEWWKHRKETKR